LLKAKAAIVFNTSNTDAKRERNVFGDPLETLWKNCIFGLCGVPNVHRRMFGVIVTSTEEQRKSWLNKAREIIDQAFPETNLNDRTSPLVAECLGEGSF
jgi:putative NADPH-quinone reductase